MHLTEEELNEYLDNEIQDPARAELHLSSCEECTVRLTALQALFNEIESLPDVDLSRSLTDSFARRLNLRTPLPRWLTLVAPLQAAIVVFTIIIAAPFVANLLPLIDTPPITSILFELQSEWIAWLDVLSTFQVPAMPEFPFVKLSSLVITVTLVGASMLWLVGNGLLLRNQMK